MSGFEMEIALRSCRDAIKNHIKETGCKEPEMCTECRIFNSIIFQIENIEKQLEEMKIEANYKI